MASPILEDDELEFLRQLEEEARNDGGEADLTVLSTARGNNRQLSHSSLIDQRMTGVPTNTYVTTREGTGIKIGGTLIAKPFRSKMPSASNHPKTPVKLQREKTILDDTASELAELQHAINEAIGINPCDEDDKGSEFYDTDFSELEDSVVDDILISEYEKTCKLLRVLPIKQIGYCLSRKSITLRNRIMIKQDVLAMVHTLMENDELEKLVLDGNNLGSNGTALVAYLLSSRYSNIHTLVLSNNNICGKGIEALLEMFEHNRIIHTLDLSGNHISDIDAIRLFTYLKESKSVENLNLSYNDIGDEACPSIGKMLHENDSLRCLDLSWNKIRPLGAQHICYYLKENVVLKVLKIAMNGMSLEGAKALSPALQYNRSLLDLDISGNRLTDTAMLAICKGLQHNEGLVSIAIHNNPITSIGLSALIDLVEMKDTLALREINASTIYLHHDSVEKYNRLRWKIRGFRVKYAGEMMSKDQETLDGVKVVKNPLKTMQDYIHGKGLRMVDFFKKLDLDGDGTVSRNEFIGVLDDIGSPLTGKQLDDLVNYLDINGDGEVDYGEFVLGGREYKRKQIRLKMKKAKENDVNDFMNS